MKEAFGKYQESGNDRSMLVLGLRSHKNPKEHECMKTDRIWEWIILNINKDRLMVKIYKYTKT